MFYKLYCTYTVLFLFTAEFIIALAEKNDTFDSFKKVLLDNGAEFGVFIFASFTVMFNGEILTEVKKA